MTNLVSIVTPVYNQRDYVEQTINSVLQQTYPFIEYIIVDDGSNDGTDKILSKYNDVVKVITTKNQGQAAALNLGWSLCQGEYLSYLSADDLIAPNCIERLVAALNLNSDLVCVYPNADLISSTGKTLKKSVCRPFDHRELLVKQECYIGPGAVWRASSHQTIGGWNEALRLAPDREFWLRLSKTGEFGFLEETLSYYRLHAKSISYKTVSENISKEYLYVLDKYFSINTDEETLSVSNSAYAYAYLLICRNMIRNGDYKKSLHYFYLAFMKDSKSVNFYNIYILLRSVIGKPIRMVQEKIMKLVIKDAL